MAPNSTENGATHPGAIHNGISIAVLDYHGSMLMLFSPLLKVAQGVRWTG